MKNCESGGVQKSEFDLQKFQKLKRMSQIAIVGRYEEPIVPPKTERPSILKAAPNKFTEMARKSGDLLIIVYTHKF